MAFYMNCIPTIPRKQWNKQWKAMEKINKLDNFIRKIILGSRVRWREERKERRRKVQVLFSDTWGEFRALNFRGRPRGRWDAARHVTCKFWSGRDDDQVYKGKGKLNIATSQGSSSRRGKKERERGMKY